MRRFVQHLCGSSLFLASGAALALPQVVELQTNLGTIAIQLDYEKAPITSTNFIKYVSSGFYKNTLIHRVIKGFMMQGGGFDKATGAQKTTLAAIQNEANNGLKNLTGTVAMARTSDPNSATSQFFINYSNNSNLDYTAPTTQGWGYAVFGNVIKGMDVARAIEASPTYRPSSVYGSSSIDLPYTTTNNVVFIEAAYQMTAWQPGLSITRILVSGVGKVVSTPAGINCGQGAAQCASKKNATGTVQLTATAAAGQEFTGWRGDCKGYSATITLDATKGNHNCTAVFAAKPASLQ
jgi:cyclophilin family peptidyl-prolyl cis-trans isomerase